jgi:hypothetical protein
MPNNNVTTFMSIMLFYAILSCLIGPLIFYYVGNRSLQMAGNGFVIFSIISIILWYTKGRKMV